MEAKKTFVGIDVGRLICIFCIMAAGGAVLERGKCQNAHAAVKGFIDDILSAYDDCLGICESTARMWIKTHEGFERGGMPPIVANPLRPGLRKSGAKTGKKDAERLANKAGVNDIGDAACHVYGQGTRRVMDLLRHMDILKRERTKHLNREHGMCEKYDYPVKIRSDTSGEKHQSHLEVLKLRPGDMVLMEQYVESVRYVNRQIAQLEGMLRGEADKNEDTKLIMGLARFDVRGALLVAASIGGIERFDCPKSPVSFMGPCPTVHQTGKTVTHGRMKGRDGALAHTMMDAATVAKEHDEHMATIYERHAKRHPPLAARSRLAHKTATYVYFMLKNREPYRYVNEGQYPPKLARLK